MRKVTFILILLLSSFAITLYAQKSSLEKGEKLITEGKVVDALNLWLESIENNNGEYTIEPEVGLAFISYVTKKHFKQYYSQATTVFYAGIEGLKYTENQQLINRYYNCFSILLNEDENKRVTTLKANSNIAFANWLLDYWKIQDPVTSSITNERLIEHFERIAYAQKNYNKAKDDVFKTDARGLRYIALGPPDKSFNKTIRYNDSEIRALMDEYDTYLSTLGRSKNKGYGSSGSEKDNSDYENSKELLLRQIRLAYNYPKVEVWIYYNNLKYEKTIYLFGKTDGAEEFTELESLEDIISDRAYKNTTFSSTFYQMNPAILLQYLFYSDLAMYDPYFGNGKYNVKANMMSPSFDAVETSRQLRRQNRQANKYIKMNAKNELSSYKKKTLNIQSSIRTYRFLDENNELYVDAVIDSYVEHPIGLDVLYDGNLKIDDYELASYLKIMDKDGKLIHSYKTKSEVKYVADDTTRLLPVRDVFSIAMNNEFKLKIQNELKNKKATSHIQESIFPTYLRALGENEIMMPEPLNTDTTALELSDIVIGTLYNEDEVKYPFVISAGDILPQGENLNLYLEVYHLNTNIDNEHSYILSYEVKKEDFLGVKKDLKDNIKIKMNYNGESNRSQVNLELDLRNMDEGKYYVNILVEERSTGRTAERSKVIHVQNTDNNLNSTK